MSKKRLFLSLTALFALLACFVLAQEWLAATPEPALRDCSDNEKIRDDASTRIGRVLDAFHLAAAEADEERYFGFFTADAMFLGSDREEHWTAAEFRAWSKPHFESGRGWAFESKERRIAVTGDGRTAWFEERLDSKGHGEWRGTGVLRLIEGEWKVAQYNLTVPIPNDMLHDVVNSILEFEDHGAELKDTTIFIVRHAEKEVLPEDPDPPLSKEGRERAARLARMLQRTGLSVAYATEYIRTQATVAPASDAAGITPVLTDALEMEELAATLKSRHRGETVLVSGHSNTVPALIAALGVKEEVDIAKEEYSDIFMVIVKPGGSARLVHLGYGD